MSRDGDSEKLVMPMARPDKQAAYRANRSRQTMPETCNNDPMMGEGVSSVVETLRRRDADASVLSMSLKACVRDQNGRGKERDWEVGILKEEGEGKGETNQTPKQKFCSGGRYFWKVSGGE